MHFSLDQCSPLYFAANLFLAGKVKVKMLAAESCPTFLWPHGLSVACQAPLSIKFSRQKYWDGQLFPFLGNLPDQGCNPGLLHCRWILTIWTTGETCSTLVWIHKWKLQVNCQTSSWVTSWWGSQPSCSNQNLPEGITKSFFWSRSLFLCPLLFLHNHATTVNFPVYTVLYLVMWGLCSSCVILWSIFLTTLHEEFALFFSFIL